LCTTHALSPREDMRDLKTDAGKAKKAKAMRKGGFRGIIDVESSIKSKKGFEHGSAMGEAGQCWDTIAGGRLSETYLA